MRLSVGTFFAGNHLSKEAGNLNRLRAQRPHPGRAAKALKTKMPLNPAFHVSHLFIIPSPCNCFLISVQLPVFVANSSELFRVLSVVVATFNVFWKH
jgi:hypothetical protein